MSAEKNISELKSYFRFIYLQNVNIWDVKYSLNRYKQKLFDASDSEQMVKPIFDVCSGYMTRKGVIHRKRDDVVFSVDECAHAIYDEVCHQKLQDTDMCANLKGNVVMLSILIDKFTKETDEDEQRHLLRSIAARAYISITNKSSI